MARVHLIDREDAPAHLREQIMANADAESALFGGNPPNINSAKLTAHIPLIARWMLPVIVSMQRNGAGSILPARIKALADIKTSLVNDCAY